MISPTELEAAVVRLRLGGLVAFPTETVYGLGADALNARAVSEIFALKDRPQFDPLIVHLADPDGVRAVTKEFPAQAAALAERFWPGPLTLILPRKANVPDLVTSGLPTVGVRVPDHPVARALLAAFGGPIAAPSANRFGRVSPTCARHVRESFGEDTPLILDGGPCQVGVESTILSLAGSAPVLLRPGGVGLEELEQALGERIELPTEHFRGALPAPGLTPSHYAPVTPLELADGPLVWESSARVGLLSWCPLADLTCDLASEPAVVRVLSDPADVHEAARNLFAALRELDGLGLDRIVAIPVPQIGIGRAIQNRLERAAYRE